MGYKSILLVDDDADDAEIFASALNAISDKIKCCLENNALTALNKLKDAKLSPDIIFLDFHMPYLDGTEFLKLLRGIKELKHVPVVLYSGHSGMVLKEAAGKFKNVRYLKKHGNFRKIVELLKGILLHREDLKE